MGMKPSIFLAMTVVAALVAGTASAQMRIIPQDRVKQVSDPGLSADSASLSFVSRHIIAGQMNEDDAPETFVYEFTNVGSDVVSINRLVTSCSCATAVCPVREVPPGTAAQIYVRYDPKGHPGRFERKIFVYTRDGNAPAAVLKLSVDVSRGADLSAEWPVDMGAIRLRRAEVTLSAAARSVESLRFINLSGSPLKLECDKAFLPECLSVMTEPAEVPPGEEGRLLISFDPALPGVRETMKVILKGLGLPPSRSSITVSLTF